MASEGKWMVIGGGFRAIMGANLLAARGRQVEVLAPGERLGGVLDPFVWKDYLLDKGCHLFDNDDDDTTAAVLDILGESHAAVDVRYASVINGIRTAGVAIPDLSSFGEEVGRQVLGELRGAAMGPLPECRTLVDQLTARFGPTAGELLAKAARKIYQTPIDELAGEGLPMTLFQRIKFLDDAAALRLKEDPVLDGRIAASSQADPMQFYRHQTTGHAFRNFYPTGRGLATFCDRAEERLRAQGVVLRFNSRVERVDGVRGRVQLADGAELTADRILWAADAPRLAAAVGVDFEAEKHIHRVPMVLYYFIIPKEAEGAWTYLHDFDEETLVFRASVPGGYVVDNPCPAGQSYVCAEVPGVKDSEIWTHPEKFTNRVWAELQRHDVVRTEQPLDTHLISVPVTYTMPRAGFSEAWQPVRETLQAQPRIEGGDFWSLSKNTITRALVEILEAT